MATKKNDLIMQNKVYLWCALGTAAVLSVPLMAMLFRWDGWDWNLLDFAVMGTLLFGSSFLYVQVARVAPRKYRTLIAAGFVLAVLWIWAELAVGVFTNLGS